MIMSRYVLKNTVTEFLMVCWVKVLDLVRMEQLGTSMRTGWPKTLHESEAKQHESQCKGRLENTFQNTLSTVYYIYQAFAVDAYVDGKS